jgi:hypothetical protein
MPAGLREYLINDCEILCKTRRGCFIGALEIELAAGNKRRPIAGGGAQGVLPKYWLGGTPNARLNVDA